MLISDAQSPGLQYCCPDHHCVSEMGSREPRTPVVVGVYDSDEMFDAAKTPSRYTFHPERIWLVLSLRTREATTWLREAMVYNRTGGTIRLTLWGVVGHDGLSPLLILCMSSPRSNTLCFLLSVTFTMLDRSGSCSNAALPSLSPLHLCRCTPPTRPSDSWSASAGERSYASWKMGISRTNGRCSPHRC